MYDYGKRRHSKHDTNNSQEEEDDDEEEEEQGSEEEDDGERDQESQRPYSFREKRTATRRYSAPPISGLHTFIKTLVSLNYLHSLKPAWVIFTDKID